MENKENKKGEYERIGAFWKSMTKGGGLYYKGKIFDKVACLFVHTDKKTGEQKLIVKTLENDNFKAYANFTHVGHIFVHDNISIIKNKYNTKDNQPDLLVSRRIDVVEVPEDDINEELTDEIQF